MIRRMKWGFTLVELLVVIGIIAVLIGILLPVLGRVRGEANTVACAATLRSHMQGLLSYAAENRGTMPFGFHWQRLAVNATTRLPTGAPAPAAQGGTFFGTVNGQPWAPAFSWSKIVNDMQTKASTGGTYPASASTANVVLNASFVCAEVRNDATFMGTLNTYGFNQVVMPNASFEISPSANPQNYRMFLGSFTPTTQGGTETSIGGARLGQMNSDTAVVWDTFVTSNLPGGRLFTNLAGGPFVTDIDSGRMWEPRFAYLRYRGKQDFPLTQPYERLDQGISFPHADLDDQFAFGRKWVNRDSATGSVVVTGQLGGIRFRHSNNKKGNAGFADGSVRTFSVDVNKIAYLDSFGDKVARTDFLRSYLLIKAPGGLPQPQLPQPP